MAGINRETGGLLDGWPHVVQSLIVIFTTPLRSRVLRRGFGAVLPALLGQALAPATLLRLQTALALAIYLWEPRLIVTGIISPADKNTPEGERAGRLPLEIIGIYRPNALQGDFTPAGLRSTTFGGAP